MNVYLLRHAETKANKKGALSSGSEDGLTEYGYEQARGIVNNLLGYSIEYVLCSPYQRAIDTVSPFVKSSGVTIEIEPALAEGQLYLEGLYDHESPSYERGGNGHRHPIQAETSGQFLSRAQEAVNAITSSSVSELLVVSHGHMIREMLNIFMRISPRVRFPHDNCGLSCIEVESNNSHRMVKFINRNISSNKAN